jgi:hypothetical protein
MQPDAPTLEDLEPRKGGDDNDWKKLTPEEKLNRLSQQLDDIQRTRALVERFEQLTQKWLKRVQAAGKDVRTNSPEA